MNKYMIFNDHNNFLHIVVSVVLLHGQHLRVYHKTHPIKKQFIKYGNILLGVHFKLRYSKLKSDY